MENTTNNNTVLRSESERINALKRYQILDTPSEYVFEQVVQLAVRMFDVPVALVSFIDGDDIFFKASAGIKGIKNVNRSFSLCPLTIQTTEILLVENALENPAVMSHPSVAGENGLRFYAGAPLITADGYPIGTVCVIDYQPREFSETNRELLAGLANLLMYELEQRLTSIQKTVEFGNVAEKLSVANAEIQSANEELAASIELLQASNEQLEARVGERTTALTGKVKELADSEKNARNIVENAPFPIGIYTGKEMRVALANQAILDIWGKGNDVIGKRYAEILPELDNQDIFKQLDDVFTTGKTFVARNQQLTLVVDGVPQVFYFNYNFLALRNDEGEIYGVMNTGADVTDIMLAREEIENVARELAAMNEELAAANEEQTAANEELALINEKYKISQDELQLAINAASLATFDLDPVTGRFSGNDQLKTWFGLMPQDEIELHRATDVIAETDRPKVLAAIQQAMTYGSGGDYDTHYTIINPLNAEARIVRAKGKALFNEKQECVRLSGVLQDVTEQKRTSSAKTISSVW
jgi:PAS domain-containing protein